MRILIQRVRKVVLSINDEECSKIGQGLLVLIGIEAIDSSADIDWLVQKLVNLRVFDDTAGVMNLSIKDIDGEVMIVSQFTLHSSTKKGNRPSYIRAARPEQAIPLYEEFIENVNSELGKKSATGRFGADMQIALVNDGPVTIWIDSQNRE